MQNNRADIRRSQKRQHWLPRLADLIIAAVAAIALAPVILVTALAIKMASPGPVLFRQPRLGMHGKRFAVYKFRTMAMDAEERLQRDPRLRRLYVEHSYKIPAELDPRITRIGRLLRRLSLDELPQLINVFRGEMRLVGPRPIVEDELRHYEPYEHEFLSVKPGMTGYWQVNGRSSVDYPKRAEMELFYIRNRSIWMDLRILLKTAVAVLNRKGAF
jgi:lipopolysaccharide/colanic/teichoic acid biosynthesis glycosyltransferase